MIFYYLTLLLIPFYKHPLVSYNISGITPIKVMGGLAFFYALTAYAGAQSPALHRSRSKSLYLWLVVVLFLSMAANAEVFNRIALLRFVSILMFFVTTVLLVNSRDRLFWSVIAILIGMDISSASIVKQFIQYGSLYRGFRPGGIFGDPNYYAASAVAVFPLTLYLYAGFKQSRLLSWFCLGSLLISAAGLLLSQSRGGWLGLAAVLIFIVYRAKYRFRVAFLLGVASVLALWLSPIDVTRRFRADDTGSQVSIESRLLLLYAGLEMVKANPLVGIGMGNYKQFSSDYFEVKADQIAHNSYLELAAENGIPALILFLLMCVATFKDNSEAIRLHSADALTHAILIGIRVGMIGFLVSATFISAEYERMFWVLCFLTMASLKISILNSATEVFEGEFVVEPLAQATLVAR